MDQKIKQITILNQIHGLEIEIPFPKNWFVIIFLTFWLVGWAVGEFFALTVLFGELGMVPVNFFIMVWITFWTIGGLVAFRTWVQMIRGKEMVVIDRGKMQIYKKGDFLNNKKIYNLTEVRNIQPVPVKEYFDPVEKIRDRINGIVKMGRIQFEYRNNTIRFAQNVSDEEIGAIIKSIEKYLPLSG